MKENHTRRCVKTVENKRRCEGMKNEEVKQAASRRKITQGDASKQ